jgi:hypothetical protein
MLSVSEQPSTMLLLQLNNTIRKLTLTSFGARMRLVPKPIKSKNAVLAFPIFPILSP